MSFRTKNIFLSILKKVHFLEIRRLTAITVIGAENHDEGYVSEFTIEYTNTIRDDERHNVQTADGFMVWPFYCVEHSGVFLMLL